MIKRLFPLMIAVTLSALLGMGTSHLVLGARQGSDQLLNTVFDLAGISRSSNTGGDSVEGLSEGGDGQSFKHLYLYMYQTVKEQPQQLALEAVSERVDYEIEELEGILFDGDFTIIREKLQTADQETITRAWSDLVSRFNFELAFQESNQRLAHETTAENIFYDNNLTNSGGVDLLYDISLINFVFFGEFIELPDRGSGSVDLASIPGGDELIYDEEDDFRVLLASEDEFNPNFCLDNSDLRDQLDEFEDILDGNVEPGDPRGSILNNTPPREEPPLPGSAEDVIENDTEVDSIEQFDELIESFGAAKADWSREIPCNEIFCIEVNFVKGSFGFKDADNTHRETDNNIAAHVTFIKERLDDTISKPLAPSKVSMNWFEDATCKEAGGKINLDLNIQAIPKPIKLDPGDGIDEVPAENIKDLTVKLKASGALPNDEKLGVDRGDLECSKILNFNRSAGLTEELTDALEACQQAEIAEQTLYEEIYDGFDFEVRAQVDDKLHEQVSGQLATTLAYLELFRDGLKQTYEVDNAPLPTVLSKPYCK